MHETNWRAVRVACAIIVFLLIVQHTGGFNA